LNGVLDEALAETGLSREDLDWIGPQVAGFAQIDPDALDEPRLAVLLAVDDMEGAKSALDTFVQAAKDRGETVTTQDHDGVQVFVSDDPSFGAVALVDDVMVLSSSASVIDDVIGTAPGDSLAASPRFRETMAQLPEDHLAMVYMDVHQLFLSLEEFATQMGVAQSQLDLGDADALEGMGVTFSAEPNGLAIDVYQGVDASKLSDEARAALGSDHANA
jgi:hypothetical protein